jgi:hypothetical protein
MTLFLAWVVFPLVLAVLALGCGFLLERLVGRRLPGALLLPAGFSVILVAASLTTMSSRTADLTSPLVVALAVAGLGLALPFRRRRPDGWALAVAAAVFAVYAAPIVLSGGATFAGYISLDDTSTWLALADNALTHGRSVAGLAPSTYSAVLNDDLGSGYPIGAMLPLGIGHELTGQDAAWLFQPYVAFLAALLGLSIYGVVSPMLRRRLPRAFVAFVGSQPALLFGYAFWSGIKEVTVAYLIALVSALATSGAAAPWRARAFVPLGVAGAGVLVCLSVLGVVWLGGLTLFVLLLASAHGARRAGASLAVVVACGLVLSLPALATARLFVRVADESDVGNKALGNLLHPLSSLQLLGIWPTGDFRGRPAHMAPTYLLIGLLAVAAAFGVLEAARRGAWGLPLYAVVSVGGWALVIALDALGHGSPWLDAKALASASPAVLTAALAGAMLLLEHRRREAAAAGVVTAVAVAGGVLWSNALAYGSVWLAPHDQLAELQEIGARFAGEGPALMTEYQPYGVRHFLRSLDAEGASERRVRPVTLRTGGVLGKGQYADLDDFDLGALLVYRTLVLRTSPTASRPPSAYVPVWSGRWYEVWQRPLQPGRILDHLALGTGAGPLGVPACGDVLRLGALAARSGGRLVAAERPQPEVVDLARSRRPASWPSGAGGTVLPTTSGTLTDAVDVPRRGRYGFWLGGSFRGRVRLLVDGRPVGDVTDQLEETAQLTPLGSAPLAGGRHRVELRYDGPGLRPGSRGAPFPLGPLELGSPATASRLVRVAPEAASTLCGLRLDWIDAVG